MHLRRADLVDLRLDGANLTGADFPGTTEVDTVFDESRLNGAKFDAKSDLSGACLIGADLTDAAGLDEANLTDALADARTRWPAGFGDPASHGVRAAKTDSCLE